MHRSTCCLVTILAATTLVAVPAAAQPHEQPIQRDPQTAFAMSLGGTLLSTALVGAAISLDAPASVRNTLGAAGITGLVVAPSFGHVYGGDRWFTVGAKLRLAGLGVTTLGATYALANLSLCFGGCGDTGSTDRGAALLGAAVGAVGLGMFIGGAIHDVATAGRETERANDARNQKYYGLNAQLAPTIVSGVHGPAAGAGITGTF